MLAKLLTDFLALTDDHRRTESDETALAVVRLLKELVTTAEELLTTPADPPAPPQG